MEMLITLFVCFVGLGILLWVILGLAFASIKLSDAFKYLKKLISKVSVGMSMKRRIKLKDISMDANKMKDKAKLIIIKKNWDVLLMDAYLTTQYFVAWSSRDDFDECWNVGVRNVKGVKRNIDVSYINEETEFLTGEFNGIYFELGGVTDYSSMPDGDPFYTTNLSLFIDDKRVLAVRYVMNRDEAYSPEDYSLLSVEEFHNHQSIDLLLNGIRLGKLEQERKSKERDRLENEKKYDGKFTF